MTGKPAAAALAGLLVALLVAAGPVRADALDDALQTVWESLWDQTGTPRQVYRWKSPVRYRIHGPDSARHAAHLRSALTAVGQAAGVDMIDVSTPAEADTEAALDIEVVNDRGLRDNEPCATEYLQISHFLLEKVRVRMRSSDAWRCAFHEAVHVMGIAGHPSGKTVLSYFPYRSDVLMDLDRLLLAAWYSPRMGAGATPLEALQVLSDAVVQQPDLGVALAQARDRAQAFNLARLSEMEALARGQGEIPAIVLRSGKASVSDTAATRARYAYFVARAYLLGVIAPRDRAAASAWFELAARNGFSPAQVMWARALRDGLGVPADPVAAYGWFSVAARQGNPVAGPELARLEESLDAQQLEQARSQPSPQTTP